MHFALHILIAALGVAALVAGGALAYGAYSKERLTLQKTAGLLLIAGFACLGVAPTVLAACLCGDGPGALP